MRRTRGRTRRGRGDSRWTTRTERGGTTGGRSRRSLGPALKLSKSTFRLELRLYNQPPWLGTFKIIDHNHIHNIDQNYIAVRVE